MAKVDSVEFNVFEGYPTYSLCEALGRAGYACSACVASEPGYYNSRSAYRSLQFRRVDFLNMRNSYLRASDPRDRFLFDGDLLAMGLVPHRPSRPLASSPPLAPSGANAQ